MQFTVKTPIRYNGVTYGRGETIELDKEDAIKLKSALVNPPRSKDHDPNVSSALRSQETRVDPAEAAWKTDDHARAVRAEEAKIEAAARTPVTRAAAPPTPPTPSIPPKK
jgi:hypothetical protein